MVGRRSVRSNLQIRCASRSLIQLRNPTTSTFYLCATSARPAVYSLLVTPRFRFGDLAFDLVSSIEPERDAVGAIRDFTPHMRVKRLGDLKPVPGGEGPFCKFSVSNQWRGRPGVYVFLVDAAPVYVGECECLVKRINQGYGCIAPRNCFVGGQSTNVRINRLIRDAVKHARTVELVFHYTDVRKRVESEMIRSLRPRWNRTTGSLNLPSAASTKVSRTPSTTSDELPPSHESTCRDQILEAARDIVRKKRCNEFTVLEAQNRLQEIGTKCSESAIRTHITSRCCRNAPKNHGVTYEDFERIGRGLYRII